MLLLAALTVLAAPVDNDDSNISRAVHVSADSDLVNATPNFDDVSLFNFGTPMTSAQVDALTPYTYYASAGYCNPSVTQSWTCGATCSANPGLQPIASGGDGSIIQFCS